MAWTEKMTSDYLLPTTMAWTEKMVSDWQKTNKMTLEEVNKTLSPPTGHKGKIGIFLFGQAGDIMEAMSVLKYIDDLWPDKDIIWFANFPNADILKYSNVSEVRMWPWAGNGLPLGTPDFYPLLCNSDNRLNKELASKYELTKDLEDGYFPAPHMVAPDKRKGIEYSNVSKQIFGVPPDWEWHPLLVWSAKERIMIKELIDKLPVNRKNILLETFAGSGQSPYWTSETTKKIMQICREKLGPCNFIFGSHKHLGGENNCGISNEQFFDDAGCISCSNLTVRQVGLINNYCDLMIGLSSGVSVATSAWGLKPTPKIQWCGSRICSTAAIANGRFELVTTDLKTREVATTEFENKLIEILKDT